MKSEFIKEWERATENLKEYFVAKYFGSTTDVYWVSDEIGEVLVVNDYFFNLQNIIDFLRYKYSKEDMFNYYDYSLSMSEHHKNTPITNIKNWIKLI